MSTLILDVSKVSNGKFTLGKHSYGTIKVCGNHLLDEMVVGSFCSIGQNVELIVVGWHHNPQWFTTYPFSSFPNKWSNVNKIKNIVKTKRYVSIGNDVWIGQNVLIMSDVTIGDGVIIGSNAVVSKDIPPYTIAVGNSIRFIRKRFSNEDIEFLLKLKWWDWDDSKINNYLEVINNGNIEKLKNI